MDICTDHINTGRWEWNVSFSKSSHTGSHWPQGRALTFWRAVGLNQEKGHFDLNIGGSHGSEGEW